MVTGSVRSAGVLTAILFFAQCSPPSSGEIRPPDGFRAIAESEYSADWQLLSDAFPTPDRTDGDFDGDGELDQARLWIHESGQRWVLMAYLSSMPGDPVKVYESGRRTELSRRPIRAIPPGEHKTDRYFGIGPGHGDTTAVVHFTFDAINLGYSESEGTTFVWNQETQVFDPIAMY